MCSRVKVAAEYHELIHPLTTGDSLSEEGILSLPLCMNVQLMIMFSRLVMAYEGEEGGCKGRELCRRPDGGSCACQAHSWSKACGKACKISDQAMNGCSVSEDGSRASFGAKGATC